MSQFTHVSNLWNDAEANALSGADRLVYRSNKLGADQRVTNTGGGNTSSKLTEKDPLTGQDVTVLWVKGSGGDLRTASREFFSSLYQDRLIGLQTVYAARADKGLKSPAEDDMVAMYSHTTFNLNPRASSIDTPCTASSQAFCRSHAPQRNHRHRRGQPLRGTDPGDLRGLHGLRPLDAPRF